MHDRHEQIIDLRQLLTFGRQLGEQIVQSAQEHLVVVGFSTRDLNFLLQLRERSSVGRFVLLKEFKHLLDALAA